MSIELTATLFWVAFLIATETMSHYYYILFHHRYYHIFSGPLRLLLLCRVNNNFETEFAI